MVYYWEFYDFYVPSWILRGAIVDGIRYGTVDAVNRGVQPTFPSSVSLLQNYPNPFNPSTVIEYAVPERSQVDLRVYNLRGQEVAVIAHGVQDAGTHQARFDGLRLSSGCTSTDSRQARMPCIDQCCF